MPVDPILMMVAPGPMTRDPAPVSSAGPIARAVSVIWTIAHFDVDTDRISGAHESAHAKQSCKKQSKFLHRCFLVSS
jgi:hypothetical protein